MNEVSREAVAELRYWLDYCHRREYSFAACLKEARKQYQQEVRTTALNAPMPQ